MSYNISTIDQKECRLELSLDLFEKYRRSDDLPMGCFLTDDNYFEINDQVVKIKKLQWNSEWSGNSIDLLKEILAETKGNFKGLIVWEGGDFLEVLTVKDGEVTIKDLEY